MKYLNSTILMSILMSILMLGCNKKSDDTVKITGNLGQTYAYYKAPWYDFLSPTLNASSSYYKITDAVAVPIYNEEILMHYAIPLQINSDGEFTGYLGNEFNWVVLFHKKDNDGINFLSIPDSDSNETVINIPISQSVSRNLDFSVVTLEGDEVQSSNNLDEFASQLGISSSQLKMIAKVDNTFKAVANSYRNNYQKAYGEGIFETLQTIMVAPEPLNTTTPSLASNYRGFGLDFTFAVDSSISNMINKIKNNEVSVSLSPEFDFYFETADQNYSIMSSKKEFHCQDSEHDDYFCQIPNGGLVSLSYGKSHGGTLGFFGGESTDGLAQNGTIAPGLFDLNVSNTTVAKFDLNYNLPVVDHHLSLPIPAVKLHTDSTGKVDHANVTWHLYNSATDAYDEIEFAKVASLFSNFGSYISHPDDSSADCEFQPPYEYMDFTKCNNDTTFTLDDLDLIVIQYNQSSTHVRFNFYGPNHID